MRPEFNSHTDTNYERSPGRRDDIEYVHFSADRSLSRTIKQMEEHHTSDSGCVCEYCSEARGTEQVGYWRAGNMTSEVTLLISIGEGLTGRYKSNITLDSLDSKYVDFIPRVELDDTAKTIEQLKGYIDKELAGGEEGYYAYSAYKRMSSQITKYLEYEALDKGWRTLRVASRMFKDKIKEKKIYSDVSLSEIQNHLIEAFEYELSKEGFEDGVNNRGQNRSLELAKYIVDDDMKLRALDIAWASGHSQLALEIEVGLEQELEAKEDTVALAGLYALRAKYGVDVHRNIDHINTLLDGELDSYNFSTLRQNTGRYNSRRLVVEALAANHSDLTVQKILEDAKQTSLGAYHQVMARVPADELNSKTRRYLGKHVKQLIDEWSKKPSFKDKENIWKMLSLYVESGIGRRGGNKLATYVEDSDRVVGAVNTILTRKLRGDYRYQGGLIDSESTEIAEVIFSQNPYSSIVLNEFGIERLATIEREFGKGRHLAYGTWPKLPYIGIIKAAIRRGELESATKAYMHLEEESVISTGALIESSFALAKAGAPEIGDEYLEEISLLSAKIEVLETHMAIFASNGNSLVEKIKFKNMLEDETGPVIGAAEAIPSPHHRFVALQAVADMYVGLESEIPDALINSIDDAKQGVKNSSGMATRISYEEAERITAEYVAHNTARI